MNKNYTKCFNTEESLHKHADFIPKNMLAIISGSSGCGKTNLVLNFLLNKDILSYNDVYIYSPTLYQPAYKYLENYFNNLEDYIFRKCRIKHKILHLFGSDEDIVDPSELDRSKCHVMIFDDVMNSNQDKIRDYFCKGRHNNVCVFYLCQSLLRIPKHSIRDNANVFILFRQDEKTLKYFYDMHVSSDMDFKEFKNFCDESWNENHGYVVINLWEEPCSGKYLQNYECMYIPEKYKQIAINRNKSK